VLFTLLWWSIAFFFCPRPQGPFSAPVCADSMSARVLVSKGVLGCIRRLRRMSFLFCSFAVNRPASFPSLLYLLMLGLHNCLRDRFVRNFWRQLDPFFLCNSSLPQPCVAPLLSYRFFAWFQNDPHLLFPPRVRTTL